MTCRVCGGEVDDPFWDDLCPECEHEMQHDLDANFHPECGFCSSEAEDADWRDGDAVVYGAIPQ